jgi:hypothetical protein
MSYILTHLPKFNLLKKELEETPTNISYYAKYGAYVGDTDSMNYLNEKLKEYYESKKN